MLFRNCAGGIVFYGDKVFLLKNEKQEWVFPKGLIREGATPREVAQTRVKVEAGIDTEVVCPAGHTCYEFYSVTRQKPVCNEISWFVLKAKSDSYAVCTDQGFTDGGWFEKEEALEMVTYSKDRKLLLSAYEKKSAKR